MILFISAVSTHTSYLAQQHVSGLAHPRQAWSIERIAVRLTCIGPCRLNRGRFRLPLMENSDLIRDSAILNVPTNYEIMLLITQ